MKRLVSRFNSLATRPKEDTGKFTIQSATKRYLYNIEK